MLCENGDESDYQLMKDIMHYMRHYPDLFHHPREDVLFGELVRNDDTSGGRWSMSFWTSTVMLAAARARISGSAGRHR